MAEVRRRRLLRIGRVDDLEEKPLPAYCLGRDFNRRNAGHAFLDFEETFLPFSP